MKELKKKIQDFAKADGIDLIGFADKSRFEGLDERVNRLSYILIKTLFSVLNKK